MATRRNYQYRTTIIFSLKDEVGALYNALGTFKKYKINLTRIISRPHQHKEWQYIFFVEIEGQKVEVNIKKALKELENNTTSLYVMGSYPLTVV